MNFRKHSYIGDGVLLTMWKLGLIIALLVFMVAQTSAGTSADGTIADGDYYIVAKHSSKALTVFDHGNGGRILGQSTRLVGSDTSQRWTISTVAGSQGGGYRIQSKRDGAFLASGGANENGDTSVILKASPSAGDQAWQFTPHLNSYGIALGGSGTTLNVTGADTADDAKVIVYDASLDDNAQWLLYPAGKSIGTVPASMAIGSPSLDNSSKRYQVFPMPTAAREADRLRRMKLMDYQPSGLYLRKGEKVSLSVSGLGLSPDDLVMMVGPPNSFEDESPRNDPQLVLSVNGSNDFTASRDGMLYFVYADSGYNDGVLPPVEVEITRGGSAVPLYIKGKTSANDWRQMIRASPNAPFIEILGTHAAITVTQKSYLHAMQGDPADPAEVLDSLEQIMQWYNALSGLDGSSELHRPSPLRVHYLQDTVTPTSKWGDIYMYAADYFVGMPGENVGDLLDVNTLRQAWSIWHETGHKYQQSDWTWGEILESTVNLYSLQAQSHFGHSTRLDEQDPDSGKSPRDLAAKYLAREHRDFNDSSQMGDGDVWVRLVMFAQLGDGLGPSFYPRLHRYYREHPLGSADAGDKAKQAQAFILRASLVAGSDLSRFFSDWGWTIEPATASRLKQLGMPAADPGLSRQGIPGS